MQAAAELFADGLARLLAWGGDPAHRFQGGGARLRITAAEPPPGTRMAFPPSGLGAASSSREMPEGGTGAPGRTTATRPRSSATRPTSPWASSSASSSAMSFGRLLGSFSRQRRISSSSGAAPSPVSVGSRFSVMEKMRPAGSPGWQLVRYTGDERLFAIIDEHERSGCPIFNPHDFTLEGGGMKKVDRVQLAFKREADPLGLLNPGKMIGWEDPDYDRSGERQFLYGDG